MRWQALRHGRALLRSCALLGVCVVPACGGGGSTANGGGLVSGPVIEGPNVLAIDIGVGPSATLSNVNIPYVTVTVCTPGTSSCAAIDHVLLDTGSVGLRLMGSVLAATGLSLPDRLSGSNIIGECLPFAGGYTWGPVVTADIRLAGEHAAAVSIQIIDDTGSAFAAMVPPSCSGNPPSLNSVASFFANGILGVGVRAADCGALCEAIAGNDRYFSCDSSTSSCSGTTLAVAQQVTNPVVLFAQDNNGIVVQLPAISPRGVAAVKGSLIFGIGTQANNTLGNVAVLGTDESGNLSTLYNGMTLDAIIDTGSNALDFPDSTIAGCPSNYSGFYCPPRTLSLSATIQGTNGTLTPIDFQIANIQALRNNNPGSYAFNDIGAGPVADHQSGTFDWGLPFFYGRNVYTAISGQPTPAGDGPFYAYQP